MTTVKLLTIDTLPEGYHITKIFGKVSTGFIEATPNVEELKAYNHAISKIDHNLDMELTLKTKSNFPQANYVLGVSTTSMPNGANPFKGHCMKEGTAVQVTGPSLDNK